MGRSLPVFVRSNLVAQLFDEKAWEARLASALDALSATQEPFLEAYWQANGFPTQVSFNGRDETPFPSDDLYSLYECARHAERFGNAEYYKPLRASLDPVRGVLRSHPCLTRAMGLVVGNDDLQVGVLNGSSWISLSHMIAGQMARRKNLLEKSFGGTVTELNSLLQLSIGRRSSPLPSDLDLGYDIAIFHGAQIRDKVDLGEGYLLMPYTQLSEYVDDEWLEDIAPDQIRHRSWQSFCAVVHPFRWKPKIGARDSVEDQPVRMPPPLFQRWVSEFMNLLAVSLGKPFAWMMTLEGCVPRTACDLLGVSHISGPTQRGRSVGHLFDPFKNKDIANSQLIEDVKELFAKRRETSYAELAPVVQRLSEALGRDGRYADEDRVLDLAVALERLFKPSDKGISSYLQNAIAELLGSGDDSKDQLRHDVKHFYDVRSAIIHGPTNEKKRRLRAEAGEAFRNGFEIARKSLLKMLE